MMDGKRQWQDFSEVILAHYISSNVNWQQALSSILVELSGGECGGTKSGVVPRFRRSAFLLPFLGSC